MHERYDLPGYPLTIEQRHATMPVDTMNGKSMSVYSELFDDHAIFWIFGLGTFILSLSLKFSCGVNAISANRLQSPR
jgi:hypothetical protein